MNQSKSKSRMDGAADAFIDQRLALGRVAFPLADLVKDNRAVGDGSQKSVVAAGKPGDESFAAPSVFSDRQS